MSQPRVSRGDRGGDLGPEAGAPRGRPVNVSRMPDEYLDRRTAAFLKMSTGRGKPSIWGAGKRDAK